MDILILFLSIAQLGNIHRFRATLREAYVEKVFTHRYILVRQHLAGGQQTIQRVTTIGVSTEVLIRVVLRRSKANVVTHHHNVVRLQRIGQQATGENQSSLRGCVLQRAKCGVVEQNDAIARHLAFVNVGRHHHDATDGDRLAVGIGRGILVYDVADGTRAQRESFYLALDGGVIILVEYFIGYALCGNVKRCDKNH